MISVIPDNNLGWIYTYYPVTFLSYLLYYSLYKSIPYKIPLWKSFKPKWELALEVEED